jgi:hypothetical protein
MVLGDPITDAFEIPAELVLMVYIQQDMRLRLLLLQFLCQSYLFL